MRYQAVIFDLFGTLIDYRPRAEHAEALRQMAEALGAPTERFGETWRGTRPDRDAGRFGGLADDLAHVCRLLGMQAEPERIMAAAEVRLALYRRHLVPREAALETLAAIRAVGCRVGLVSDCASEIPMVWPAGPFAPLVDAAVFSCEVGCTKPDSRLYQAICQRLGVPADACLYVGDGGSHELTGALRAGMHPVLIRSEYGADYDVGRRPDALEWRGLVVTALPEVLALLHAGRGSYP